MIRRRMLQPPMVAIFSLAALSPSLVYAQRTKPPALDFTKGDVPNDPRRMVQRAVTSALFAKDRTYAGGLLVESLGSVDRRLLL